MHNKSNSNLERLPNDKLLLFQNKLYYGNNLQPVLTSGLSAHYIVKTYNVNSGQSPFDITIQLDLPEVADSICYMNVGHGFVGQLNRRPDIAVAKLNEWLFVYNKILIGNTTQFRENTDINKPYLHNASIASLRAINSVWHPLNTISYSSIDSQPSIQNVNYYRIMSNDSIIENYFGTLTISIFYIA